MFPNYKSKLYFNLIFTCLCMKVEKFFNLQIRCIQTDNGDEFVNSSFCKYEDNGITLSFSYPYVNPKWVGRASASNNASVNEMFFSKRQSTNVVLDRCSLDYNLQD